MKDLTPRDVHMIRMLYGKEAASKTAIRFDRSQSVISSIQRNGSRRDIPWTDAELANFMHYRGEGVEMVHPPFRKQPIKSLPEVCPCCRRPWPLDVDSGINASKPNLENEDH